MDQAEQRSRIERLYALALGRAPEPGADLSGFMDKSLSELTAIFFQSPEFRERVADVFTQGAEPRDALFDYPPSEALKGWAVAAFDLSEPVADATVAARSWAQLYRALFTEADVAVRMGMDARPFDGPAWAAVLMQAEADAKRRVAGAVESVDSERVVGWAVDLNDPGRLLAVELWADGAFVSAAATGAFRRDLEDRFPGATGAGYSLPIPRGLAASDTTLRLEVRETGHPAPLGLGVLAPPDSAEIPAYESVRRELATVRETLARLETMLPALEPALTRRASDWSAYFDAWYRPAHAAIRAALPVAAAPGRTRVRIDAAGCSPAWVEEAIDSALEQSRRPAGVFVVGLDDQGRRLIQDLAVRRGWMGANGPAIVIGEPTPDVGPVLAFPASGLLSPDAVETIEALFEARPDAVLAYVDEDVLADDADGDADWRLRDHVAPVLKPAFDLDFVRQSPWIGDCLAFAGDGVPAGARTALAAAEAGAVVVAAPRVLFTRRAEAAVVPDAQGWAEVVRAHLARMGEAAEVAPQADILGASAPGAVRVRHALAEGVSATVIIPTRDRLDLLRPCLDSLEAHRAANRCAMRVVVVDHLSREAETRALLMERQAAGQIEVLPYGGEFNWALMNNLAAAQSDDDVLVFLNNDTVVISPDWLDALAAQAMRPGVGVVGARLVYQDGAIQHAGMVARPRPTAFLIHEGVGLPGADPGNLGRHALAHRCVAVTGACMAASNAVFRRLGGFDATRLPVEGNDVDLCLKAQAEGLSVIYEPGATLYHLESRSRGLSLDGERLRASMEATRRVWDRWGGRFADDPGFNPHFAREGRPFDRLRPPPPIQA